MNEEKYIHQQMKGKQPFKVPEGYFDDLAMRIMTNLPDAEQHGETPTVAVNKHRTVRLWISVAAACLAVMVVATALLSNRILRSKSIRCKQQKCLAIDLLMRLPTMP